MAEHAVDAILFANRSIGKSLRARRTTAGLSQTEVAKKAAIRPEMLCRIESGSGNPTVSTISKIVRAIKALSR